MAVINGRFLINAWNRALGRIQNITASYNALLNIDFVHERIHAGKCYYLEGDSVQVAGTTRYMLLKTGAEALHLRDFGLKTNQGPFNAYLYKDCFIGVGSEGTLVPFNNLNLNSSNGCSTLLYANPGVDVNSFGALIDHGVIYESAGGAIKEISGDVATIVTEWVLKPNTNYVASFVNSSTNDADYHQYIIAYETD